MSDGSSSPGKEQEDDSTWFSSNERYDEPLEKLLHTYIFTILVSPIRKGEWSFACSSILRKICTCLAKLILLIVDLCIAIVSSFPFNTPFPSVQNFLLQLLASSATNPYKSGISRLALSATLVVSKGTCSRPCPHNLTSVHTKHPFLPDFMYIGKRNFVQTDRHTNLLEALQHRSMESHM
jgi:hypothetical protein